MTTITILKSKQSIRGFRVRGHSGFKPRGEDVLCAAVSMLAMNTINALTELVGLKKEDIIKLEMKEEIPSIGVILSAHISEPKGDQCQLLMQTFELGIKSLANDSLYQKHIVLEYRRKNDD